MNVRRLIFPFLTLLVGSTFLTSCIKDNSYSVKPSNSYYNVFDEEFNNDHLGWGFTNSHDSSYADVQGGTYELVNYSAVKTHTATVPTGADLNYDFQIQARVESTYEMALIFGASNYDYGYSFFIDDNGYFAVYKEGGNNSYSSTIIDWKASDVIQKGDWNDLEIDQSGNDWIGFINGTQVFRITAYQTQGSQCGFMVMPGTTGYADYLTVRW